VVLAIYPHAPHLECVVVETAPDLVAERIGKLEEFAARPVVRRRADQAELGPVDAMGEVGSQELLGDGPDDRVLADAQLGGELQEEIPRFDPRPFVRFDR
jgi:hypothetical protein